MNRYQVIFILEGSDGTTVMYASPQVFDTIPKRIQDSIIDQTGDEDVTAYVMYLLDIGAIIEDINSSHSVATTITNSAEKTIVYFLPTSD